MNRYLHFVRLTFAFGLAAISTVSLAQISGPGSETRTSTYNYNCFNDGYYLFTTPTWTITPSSAGIVKRVIVLSDHYTSEATIQWNQAGPATITCTYGSSFTETYNVTVACGALPIAPTSHIVSGPICTTSGQATLDGVPGTNGDNVKWYTASTGGTLLSTGIVYTTPTISSQTSYFVSSINSGGYCESTSRYEVIVNLGNTVPGMPTAKVDAARCEPGSVTLSATPSSPATSIRWYISDVGGAAVATGTNYSPNLTHSGDYYYYAASFDPVSSCSSTARLPVKATMGTNPPDLIFSASTAFGSGNIALTAEATSIKKWAAIGLTDTSQYQVRWFTTQPNADANTPLLAKGLQYTTPLIGATTPYYARLHDKTTGCLGPVSIAMAYIAPLLARNSVKTEIIRVAGKKVDTDLIGLTDAQKSTTIVYIDGLSRASQQIGLKASPDGKDMIRPVEYDAFGRVTKQYLPYVSDTSTTGRFHSGFAAEQYNFYQVNNDKIANDTSPFSKTKYEPSPLGRVIEQTKIGQVFQPGSGHTGNIVYGFNTGSTSSQAEEVRKFNPDGSSTVFYTANILSRTEGVNPDGIRTITFTDAVGRTIVTKQQLDETIGVATVSYLETYYIYDDLGQLKFMIQPEGVAALKALSWNFNASGFKEQHVFQYIHDKRGRLIESKVPGKGWSYTVYNQLNQPVLTQDALLKATNQWLFVKYDRVGRVVMTGLFTDNTNITRTYFQTLLDNKNYNTEKYFETRNTTGTHKYTNAAFPTANTEVLSVSYYDTYDFDSYGTYIVQSLSGEGTQGQSISKVTGSKTLIHGTANWLKKFVYYDTYGRPIQVRSNNYLNLTPDNLSTTVYDFEKVLLTKNYHNAGTPGNTTVLNTYEYYDQGRLKQVKQKK